MMGQPLRILLTALGGEGGGVLMNWIVKAARETGLPVQATSVPGVAQRTGSTSYYIEIGSRDGDLSVFNLVPMPGRVDVVVSSELVETGRVLTAGYVSPDRTTLISSTARFFTTAEKIDLGDGRYSAERIEKAARALSKTAHLLHLSRIAAEHGTYVSATMFGALSASGVLPWALEQSRNIIEDTSSLPGFDAAARVLSEGAPPVPATNLPKALDDVTGLGVARTTDFQDAAYGDVFSIRAKRLTDGIDLGDHRLLHAATEGCRRLALWMSYEDIARVADLKTRPERFQSIRDEVQLEPGQILAITEYMKPRAEEVADVLPVSMGRWLKSRADAGRWIPFLGRGRRLRSNGVFGYWMLRAVARLKRFRRRSLRFHEEDAAIEEWLSLMEDAMKNEPDFAMALAELPRVLKGYSDTMARGKRAYDRIMADIVRPAAAANWTTADAAILRGAIGAALADDSHEKLDAVLRGKGDAQDIPQLKRAAHA